MEIIINFERDINASEKHYFDLTDPTLKDDLGIVTRDYAPYKNIKLINAGSSKLKLKINNMKAGIVVPANTIFELEYYAINSVEVENLDSTIAGKYYLILDTFDNLKTLIKQLVR